MDKGEVRPCLGVTRVIACCLGLGGNAVLFGCGALRFRNGPFLGFDNLVAAPFGTRNPINGIDGFLLSLVPF